MGGPVAAAQESRQLHAPALGGSAEVLTRPPTAVLSDEAAEFDGPLPTVDDYERELRAVRAAQRRLRDLIREAALDGEAWMADTVRFRLLVQCLDAERKTVMSLREAARQREMPELVERMERAVAKLRSRRGRLAQLEQGEQEAGVH